jgi:ferredoxin
MELTPENREQLDKLSKMSREERWNFWVKELSACVKCYACRAACPLCYCEQCTVDCNKPQWISVPSHQLGNMEWHIMRAMHLAGRCVDCGDCYRACPLGIPLNLLTQKLHQDITDAFIISGVEEEKPAYPLGTFRPDDKEDFIR